MEPLKEANAIKSEISRVIANTAYQTYEKRLLKEVKEHEVPHHVAVIMDGNRRFAKGFGLTPTEGHLKGKDKLEEVLDWCMELGVKVLTVYAFSTENFERDEGEVDSLMQMFEENFYRLGKDERVHRHGIKVRVLGQRDLLPEGVIKAI
ncbi:MAG TPA: polyprenyl diphosphate synthase, partial [Methanomassiliicoccaceae archaeon]|nr:polyprenyl diphosphate synthase [Methanomassiliicoccaceae archaeon]